MKNYDVIVVGAGIVGLAHAYTAALRGLKVLVIERDAACIGASIRNFGFVTVTGQRAGDHHRRAMRSRDIWASIAPQAGIEVVHRGLWLTARRPTAHAVLKAFMQTDMAQGCELLAPDEAKAQHPALLTDGLQSVLYSPHELRVESRSAIPRLAAWLREHKGVDFRYGEAVVEIDAPRVRTTGGHYHGERVAVCTNAAPGDLFAPVWSQHNVRQCQLQMLRVKPQVGFQLRGSVMGDLSLVRYEGYSALPSAAALRAQLEREESASLAHGIHLIAVQSADGSLVVGDSHHYGASVEPFASGQVDELILRHLREALDLREATVTERWVGTYPSSSEVPCIVHAPQDAVRAVTVTSGSGASTALGLAEEVFAAW
ncbi:MAG: TIGR03364 family FAD-dependent oxidoreductase [Burkholderiaceae bacterium]|jgi:FAD dependent oxidoreductase TIGR03364|nr:TIGR03364 family FAD-dependent oxidoreductase [Burkholderiaceae bacterium]